MDAAQRATGVATDVAKLPGHRKAASGERKQGALHAS